MNATPPPSPPTPPLPASLQHAEATDLDARILQAEQRLIARDERVRLGAHHLLQQLQAAWQPRRLMRPLVVGALAVMLAGLAIGSLWRSPGRRLRREPEAGPSARTLPWVHALTLAWPMLPQAWRARVNPATANALLTVVLPVGGWLLARRRRR
jgi:hypothetical protein